MASPSEVASAASIFAFASAKFAIFCLCCSSSSTRSSSSRRAVSGISSFASFFAAVRTIAAGVDLVLCCHEPARQHRVIDALAEAIASGRLSAERVDSAHRRLDKLFANFVR